MKKLLCFGILSLFFSAVFADSLRIFNDTPYSAQVTYHGKTWDAGRRLVNRNYGPLIIPSGVQKYFDVVTLPAITVKLNESGTLKPVRVSRALANRLFHPNIYDSRAIIRACKTGECTGYTVDITDKIYDTGKQYPISSVAMVAPSAPSPGRLQQMKNKWAAAKAKVAQIMSLSKQKARIENIVKECGGACPVPSNLGSVDNRIKLLKCIESSCPYLIERMKEALQLYDQKEAALVMGLVFGTYGAAIAGTAAVAAPFAIMDAREEKKRRETEYQRKIRSGEINLMDEPIKPYPGYYDEPILQPTPAIQQKPMIQFEEDDFEVGPSRKSSGS